MWAFPTSAVKLHMGSTDYYNKMFAMGSSEDFFCPAVVTGSTSAMPLTSSVDSSKIKYKASSVSKMLSCAGTPKSRLMLKRTLQDVFAEGSVKENQILERLGAQK